MWILPLVTVQVPTLLESPKGNLLSTASNRQIPWIYKDHWFSQWTNRTLSSTQATMQLPRRFIPRLRNACNLQLLFVFLAASIKGLLASTTFEMRFRDQVEKLTSDEAYYTDLRKFEGDSIGIMTYLPHRNTLLVGAKNAFYEVDLNSTFPSRLETIQWNATRRKYQECLIKGEESGDCQNFIQVMEYDVLNKRLLICGTHAQDPMCKRYEDFKYQTLNSLPDVQAVDGKKKCPFDPTQQSTALFAEGALYTATVGDYSGRDSVIYRSNAGQSDVVELRSREADSKWFNTPTFIQSFEVEEWVLFFFREVAVEHVNSGDAIYARVGKVCKSDMGGAFVLEEKWTTYQKARLNCSFPGAYPFYFNYLQDVWMVGEGDERLFYGVFSTGGHEIPGSAVCVFDMEDIRNIFNEGQFKEQETGKWYAVPRGMEPTPRPGNCSLNSKQQPDENLEFITGHPLMDASVPGHVDPHPIFDLTRSDYRLSQIAVYKQRAKDGIEYSVLFLGTENGIILKVALIPDSEGRVRSNLLEKIYVTPRDCQERIKEMKVIKTIVDGQRNGRQKDMLMVVTNRTVLEVPLQRCSNYSSSCSCIQDPFCVWNDVGQSCFELENNEFDMQDVNNIQDCIEEFSVPMTTPSECVCQPPSVPSTAAHMTTVEITSTAPYSRSTPSMGVSSSTVDTHTLMPELPRPPATTPGDEGSNEVEIPTDTTVGSGKEGNNPKDPSEIEGTTVIGPAVNEASTGADSSIEQVLLVVLIAGWVLFLVCVPIILYLVRSNRRKVGITRYSPSAISVDHLDSTLQKNGGTNSTENPLPPLNGPSLYHHLFPPPSPAESSTDPPVTSGGTGKRHSLNRTPSRVPILEREQREMPQGGDDPPIRSPSRKKPPVPPKRTNSFLTHEGPRCPPGYTANGSLRRHNSQNGGKAYANGGLRRQNSQTLPHKMRQNSASSAESVDPQPPPYRPLSGSSEDDQRRRRPSGASNTGFPPHEYNNGWAHQNRTQEQSV